MIKTRGGIPTHRQTYDGSLAHAVSNFSASATIVTRPKQHRPERFTASELQRYPSRCISIKRRDATPMAFSSLSFAFAKPVFRHSRLPQPPTNGGRVAPRRPGLLLKFVKEFTQFLFDYFSFFWIDVGVSQDPFLGVRKLWKGQQDVSHPEDVNEVIYPCN